MLARPVLAAALAAVLSLSACGGGSSSGAPGSAAAPERVDLVLDWHPNPDHVGVYAALERGEFRRRGLDVVPRPPADVSDPLKLVAAGRADVGISYQPELFFAQGRDLPLVAVAAIVPRALNSVIALGDADIGRPADLRGRTVGEDGSESSAAYLDAVLEHAGLDPDDDVDRVNVGFNLVPALVSGRVDAVVGVFQNVEGVQLAERGLDPSVFPVDRYGVPDYDELVLIANTRRLESDGGYRSRVRRTVAGLLAGTDWARAHPAAATAVMERRAAREYAGVLRRAVPATLRLLAPRAGERPGELDPARWERFGRWMESRGLLDEPPDGAGLVTNAYVPR